MARCVPVQDVLSQGIFSSGTTCGISTFCLPQSPYGKKRRKKKTGSHITDNLLINSQSLSQNTGLVMYLVTHFWRPFQPTSTCGKKLYYLQIVGNGSFNWISERYQQTNGRIHLVDSRSHFVLHKICWCLLQSDLTCSALQ